MCPKDLVDKDGDDVVELNINEDYARCYNYRKEKEELQELKNRLGTDADSPEEDSSDEEPEDEVGELLNPELSGQIMATISSIRSTKPEIYDSNHRFFDEKEMEKLKKEWRKKKKLISKNAEKLTLRDYHRKRITGEIKEEDSDDEVPDHKADIESNHKLCYDEEQDQARRDLRSVFNADDADNDELFTVKSKCQDQVDRENEEYRQFLLDRMAEGGCAFESWRRCNGTEVDDPDEAFLLDYVLKRGWIDHDAISSVKQKDDSDSDYSDAEEFEKKHNFRFEEPEGNTIVTHSRNIDGLVRRMDDRRITKRKKRKERKEREKSRKSEELKRYKSLKKKEIMKRLKIVQKFTEIPLETLKDIDLEGDFDADMFDQQMANLFNEEYYSKKEKLSEIDKDFKNSIIERDGKMDDKPSSKSRSRKRKTGASGNSKLSGLSNFSFRDAVDELLNIEYEDAIPGQATRFKYVRTNPVSYGLTADDIINGDDKLLNKLVSIKKLAPYRSAEEVRREEKKLTKKVLYLNKKNFNTLHSTKT